MSINSYMAFTGQVPNKTNQKVEVRIFVNGSQRWGTFDNIAQANMYWACLNIFGKNTAKYVLNGKTVAKKGDAESFDKRTLS